MNRMIPLLALTLLAACDRQDPPAAPAPTAAAPAPTAAKAKAPVQPLDGKWRLAEPAALDLVIGGGKATLSSGCLRRGYTFKQDRNQVAFNSSPAGSSNCGRSPSAAEEAAFAALADANLVLFGEDPGQVTLSGYGGTLAISRR